MYFLDASDEQHECQIKKKNRIPLTTAQKTKGNICKSKKTCRELGCQTRQNANKRNQRSK